MPLRNESSEALLRVLVARYRRQAKKGGNERLPEGALAHYLQGAIWIIRQVEKDRKLCRKKAQ